MAEPGHFPFLLAEDEVVVALHGDKLGKALLLCQRVGLSKLVGVAVGDADIARLAGFDGFVEAVHDVEKRRPVVPHVVDVEIDVIHAEVLQAPVQHAADVLLTADAGGDFLVGAGQELGGHHHAVAAGEVAQGAAKVLFAGAALVGDGGIEEVDPRLQRLTDDGAGMLLVQRPGVLAARGVAKAHAAQTDAGNSQIGVAKFRVAHSILLPKRFAARARPAKERGFPRTTASYHRRRRMSNTYRGY